MSNTVLERKLSLLQATAINMTDMVGIGPFIVLSVVADKMGGPYFLYAWLAGAFLSFTDAMIWSEFGATFPLAGGSYNFLKEGYGAKWGKFMSFLFVWQTMIQAPLVIASAAIGFAQYFSFLVPLNSIESKVVSGAVVVLIVLLLYRKIETIGKISVFLWVAVLITMTCIIAGAIWHGNFFAPVQHINDGLQINSAFGVAMGFACVKTMYSYLGYYNVCHLGGEIKNPEKNIPKSIFYSIAGIAVIYLLLNISVASVLPFDTIRHSSFIVSEYVKALAGTTAANVITGLVLLVAFASVFSATLGYSRIPFAAAKDGAFFKVFARVHRTKHFPHISLLVMGGIAFIFSLLLKIEPVINAILAMRILIQFIGQAVGLMLLASIKGRRFFKWKMPMYPLPVLIAIAMWIFIFISTGLQMMSSGLNVITLGAITFFIKASYNKTWPFENRL